MRLFKRRPFRPESRPSIPSRENCGFYHSMDFPDGDSVEGAWDIRGGFEQYIGHYPIKGKSVLDVGTASGFLAFEAERHGAATVTALENRDVSEFQRIPFVSTAFHRDRTAWHEHVTPTYQRMKNGFWYAHHKYNSNVETIYEALSSIPTWVRSFDLVIAGAIVEHLSDPVSFIGGLAMIADEAIVIAYTPVDDTDELRMTAANDWTNTDFDYTFWNLSRGLYQRIFDNVGFEVGFVPSTAKTGGVLASRHTIIAKRRFPKDSIPFTFGSGV